MDNSIATARNSYIEMRPITELKSTSVAHTANKLLCQYYCDICKTKGIKIPDNFEQDIKNLSEDKLSELLKNKPKELKSLLDAYYSNEESYRNHINIDSIISASLAIFNEQLSAIAPYFNNGNHGDYLTTINKTFNRLKEVLSSTEMRPITELKSTSVAHTANKLLCQYYCDICKTKGIKIPDNFEQDIKNLSEDKLSELLKNKPQQLKKLLDIYHGRTGEYDKIDPISIIEAQLNLFAKIVQQPSQDQEQIVEYAKQIDLNMVNLSNDILKINMNNNEPIHPELIAFVKLGQPTITQTEKGTVINQGQLGTCKALMMIMACSSYEQIIMPIAEENDTTKEVNLYLPNSTLKLDQSDIAKLQSHGITCHVNKDGIVYRLTITAEVYEKIKQQLSATSNNKAYNSMLKIVEWLVVNEPEVFGSLGTYEQEIKIASLLGLRIVYNSAFEHGLNMNISYIKDMAIADALQIMSPANPALINPDIQIRCGLKFNIDNVNDPGNHAVLFKKIVIKEGVHWVKYLNPWGEIEYITLNQWVTQLANTGVSVFAPENTQINIKDLKQPLDINKKVLTQDSQLGKSGMDLDKEVLLNNGELVAGKARCLGLTFNDGRLLTGFDSESGVLYTKGKKYQPEVVKLNDIVYIKRNGQLQKLDKWVILGDYYIDGQKISSEYKNGEILISGKQFSGFDINTNNLYKLGKRYTGLVQIGQKVFKYAVGFLDQEVTELLTEDDKKKLYKVNPNVRISL